LIRIAFVDLEYPAGWLDKSEKAEHSLEECLNAEARRELLNGHLAEVWKGLRDAMAGLSHGKCWYCESWLTRDDLVVDHYRPKGRIFEEDETREGYWWLAFKASNFRLSCKYCNELRVDIVGRTRGGKGTHFPLLEGSVRATAENRDTGREYPVILDPIIQADVDLLMFISDSRVQPRYEKDVDPIAYLRAKETITILHLDHGRLQRSRGQICSQVAEAIERCDVAYRNYLERRSSSDPALIAQFWQAYESAVQRLADYIKSSSPYAGAARSIVRRARNKPGRDWVEGLLMA
jgi:uncharacterized protein (TIGR02646 family)